MSLLFFFFSFCTCSSMKATEREGLPPQRHHWFRRRWRHRSSLGTAFVRRCFSQCVDETLAAASAASARDFLIRTARSRSCSFFLFLPLLTLGTLLLWLWWKGWITDSCARPLISEVSSTFLFLGDGWKRVCLDFGLWLTFRGSCSCCCCSWICESCSELWFWVHAFQTWARISET